MQRASTIVRSIWAACLLIAAANHARILLRHGLFWDYGGVAWASAVYWSSLTILDPIAAALLFIRPKIGVAATLLLITTNVLHKFIVTAGHAPAGEFFSRTIANPQMLSQIAFLLFAAATARIAWRGAEKRKQARPHQPI